MLVPKKNDRKKIAKVTATYLVLHRGREADGAVNSINCADLCYITSKIWAGLLGVVIINEYLSWNCPKSMVTSYDQHRAQQTKNPYIVTQLCTFNIPYACTMYVYVWIRWDGGIGMWMWMWIGGWGIGNRDRDG